MIIIDDKLENIQEIPEDIKVRHHFHEENI